ncbi:NADPH-dependent F420 reductase [Variovorax ginsengisoli]|uniref:NAD(P)-binding domain-containing protein n=1 Tax=Variovorax ginsengisoli TaxID=363844 RepID=A0ABT8SGT3_9BURK|nr:NAD(P)-binding domain-containing protein [Variovorax ginsengisoli]MDN8617521.1 NAD(P)-binding domain-containing protein [Variovorax ginsengisoli]MDO1536691.1 NAD(P)-binding domain-containing protein [Variovorax ginsengisoli]
MKLNTISIIGSGGMAAAIGGLAAKAGYAVEVMSRDATKAQALARQLGAGATAEPFGATPAGDLVIMAVPYAIVLDVVKQYGKRLAGRLLVDITNPIDSTFEGFVTPDGSFGAREIVRIAPADAVVVKAFNTQFSHVLAAGPVGGHPLDVFLAGDDAPAKASVSAFIERLGLRPLDVGPLPMAQTLEHFALLSLGLLAHSVKHSRFSLGVSLLG